MSASPRLQLKYENSGSSNDVDFSPTTEDQAGPLAGPIAPRGDRQSISKRPYRQRRKDPSCDACRERKVKCDASDAGACSECFTRGVPCCFTKESNRRMSSLKQIQDLEERLGRAKQEIIQLRMSLSHQHNDQDRDLTRLVLDSTLASQQAATNGKVDRPQAVHAREAVPITAVSWRRSTTCIYAEELPPKSTTAQLILTFERSINLHLPVVPLSDIRREVDKLFQHEKLDGVPQAWRGMLMATIAASLQATTDNCGNFTPDQFIQLALAAVDQSWSGPLSLNHVRLALLLAAYFMEADLHIASLVWYRTACTLARQTDCGLVNGASIAEAAAKHTLSTCIHWFRLNYLALHLTSASQEDLAAEMLPPLPNAGLFAGDPSPASRHLSTMLALLQLLPSRLSGGKTDDTFSIRSFEVSVAMIIGASPATLDPSSMVPLQPEDLFSTFAVQIPRMLVVLEGLTVHSLSHAVAVAEDTARLVLRMNLQQETSRVSWSSEVKLQATALLCLHLWRCQMVMCLDGQFESAKILLSLSSMIAEHHKVNRKCAVCLADFLNQLITSLEAGAAPQADQRLLAFVKDNMENHIKRGALRYRAPDGLKEPAILRRDSSDDTVFSEVKEEPVDDEWTIIDRKLGRLTEIQARQATLAKRPEEQAVQSSRSRMQLSNILK